MRYLLILIVTITLTGEVMGKYNKNLSDRHPQVKVKTFSNNEKETKKSFWKAITEGTGSFNPAKKGWKKKIKLF